MLKIKSKNKLEKELESRLLHKRFSSVKEVEKIVSEVVGVSIELEDTCNENILELDYDLMASVSLKNNENEDLYLDIYYLKTRCNDLYITEITVDLEEDIAMTEEELIEQAKKDYKELKEKIEENKSLNLEQLCDLLGGHNLSEELFDVNYGCLCATVYLENNEFVLGTSVEIWDDSKCELIYPHYGMK